MRILTLPTPTQISEARGRIFPPAVRTPLARFEVFLGGSRTPRDVYLKLETAQPIGSFKIRGAANAMARVSDDDLQRGVWTASAGNMAQGVAYVARQRGIACRVVVPDTAPRAKLDRMLSLGAQVVPVPFATWWQAMLTRTHPGMTGLMIHPFADTNVMAGNATIGLEIAEDAPDLDAVLVPWGGGGLALGIASALKSVSPRTQVYAVEVETAAPLTASLAAARMVTVTRTPTWIDGMGSDRLSDEIWPLVPGMIAGTIVVTVAQVAAVLRLMVNTAGVTPEGAGAATVAAALAGRVNGVAGSLLDARRVACVVSGGNIDDAVVAKILAGEEP
jgi:threonine dehydratase